MKERKDLSKTRDFFCLFFCWCLFTVFFLFFSSATISSIMTATSLVVTDRGRAASSLLIGVCICDVGECEGANASVVDCLFFFFFFFSYMTVLTRC